MSIWLSNVVCHPNWLDLGAAGPVWLWHEAFPREVFDFLSKAGGEPLKRKTVTLDEGLVLRGEQDLASDSRFVKPTG